MQTVTADVTGGAVRILDAKNLQIRLESFRFQEAEPKPK